MAAQEAAARRFTLVAVVFPLLGFRIGLRPTAVRLGYGRFSRGGGPRMRAPGCAQRLVLAILLARLGAPLDQNPRSVLFDFDVIQHHATPLVSPDRVLEALSRSGKKRYRAVSIQDVCRAGAAVKGRG